MSNNKPVKQLRDGSIRAAIWANSRKDGGEYHSVTITRTYEDANGNLKDADSFSGTELLRVARLVHKAYDAIAELRRQAKDATSS